MTQDSRNAGLNERVFLGQSCFDEGSHDGSPRAVVVENVIGLHRTNSRTSLVVVRGVSDEGLIQMMPVG